MMWQLIAALLGVAIMALPSLLGPDHSSAELDWVVGPIVTSVALMSASQVLRSLRWVNLLSAGALILGGVIGSHSAAYLWLHLAIGVVLILLTIPKGASKLAMGGGWKGALRPR